MKRTARFYQFLLAMAVTIIATPVFAQWTISGNNAFSNVSGNIGIGDSTPLARLSVADAGTGNTLFLLGRPSDSTGGFQFRNSADTTTVGYVIADGSEFRFLHLSGFVSFYAAGTERMRVTAAGNVGIGTTSPTSKLQVVGDANFSGTVSGGNIQAKYQDLAEWVAADKQLAAGTVVVLNRAAENSVTSSLGAYDTTVAGVVSERPGLLLGEAGANKLKIATTGRVKIKVDATKAPIAIGDLLVTSEIAGLAMKSIPMDLNGRKFHQPGTVIGKALQPLESGRGEILVLLSIQ